MSRPKLNSQGLAAALVIAATAFVIQLQGPGPTGPGNHIPPERDRDDIVWLAPDVDHEQYEGGAYTAISSENVRQGQPTATIEPGTYETRFANGAEGCSFTIRTYDDGVNLAPRFDEFFTFEADDSSAFSIEATQAIYFHSSDVGRRHANDGECPREWVKIGDPGLVDFSLDLPPLSDAEYSGNAIRNFGATTPPGRHRSTQDVHRGGCVVSIERSFVPNLGDPLNTLHAYGTIGEQMFMTVPGPFAVAPRDLSSHIEGSYDVSVRGAGCPPDWESQL